MSTVEIITSDMELNEGKLLSDGKNAAFRLKTLRPVVNPIMSHVPYRGWTGWDQPEYDFLEIVRIPEVEAIVMQAFAKKESLMFKEGWELVGRNPRTVKYIKRRLAEMSAVSGLQTQDLLRSVGAALVRTCNFFGAAVRNPKASTGKVRKKLTEYGVKKLNPIAAIFPIPVETIEIKRDTKGRLIGIRQSQNLALGAANREFKRDDYIHMKINERDGCVVGVPMLIPVLDDIRAMRRLEQNVEIMTYQYLSPLFKYTIGNEDHPAIATFPDGSDEIAMAEEQWSNLPSDGAMIMPWWHDIEVVGAKGQALDPIPLLEYYLQRVLFGIGVSPVDIGKADTASKSTADNLSRILIDGVKYIQRRIEEQFLNMIVKPLLLESTYDEQEILDENNLVYLIFKEIDVDTQIKRENHGINLFGGHAITQSELRHIVSKEPFSDEEKQDTFFELIEKELAELKLSMPPMQGGGNSNGSTQLSRGQRAAQAVTTPSNQYGRKLGPEKRKSSLEDLFVEVVDQVKRDSVSPEEVPPLLLNLLEDAPQGIKDIAITSYIRGFRYISDSELGHFDTKYFLGIIKMRLKVIGNIIKKIEIDGKTSILNDLDCLIHLVRHIDVYGWYFAENCGKLDALKGRNIDHVSVRMINKDSWNKLDIKSASHQLSMISDIQEYQNG